MLLAGVFGKWNVNKGSWQFMVNTKAGGKLFTIKDGLKFDELVQMVHEEFGIDRLVHELELGYALPKTMLRDMPKNMHHVFVSSDRQFDTLCGICRSTTVRLCISLKNVDLGDQDQGLNSRENHIVFGIRSDHSESVDRHDSDHELEVEVSNFHDAKVIEKGQWFKNKAELSWSVRMLSTERKFRIFVSKSDTKLLVVKCFDRSCSWMVRSSKTNPSCKFFWVTKFIDKHTCLSRNIGGPKASSNAPNRRRKKDK